jgi:hypothetical protein
VKTTLIPVDLLRAAAVCPEHRRPSLAPVAAAGYGIAVSDVAVSGIAVSGIAVSAAAPVAGAGVRLTAFGTDLPGPPRGAPV